MPKVEMLLVYGVDLCLSNVAGRRHGDDCAWLYSKWDNAVAQMKRCIEAHPEAHIILCTETWDPERFAALPDVSDDIPE